MTSNEPNPNACAWKLLSAGRVNRYKCSKCGNVIRNSIPPEAINQRIRTRCKASADYPAVSRGLGDTVAKTIHTVTGGKIKPCGGCKERQAFLNRVMPYGPKR